jgi:hypothetical protein
VGYSFIQRDIFVFLANEPGMLLGLFLTFTAYELCKDGKVRLYQEFVVVSKELMFLLPQLRFGFA